MENVALDNPLLSNTGKWAIYDTTQFPHVKVKMTGVIEDQEDFEKFLQGWRDLYSKNQRFTIEFDTSDVGRVSIRYAIQMRSFVRELKNCFPKLLERSTIKVNSKWVRFLLKIIFFFERPVADVYIENTQDNSTSIVKS